MFTQWTAFFNIIQEVKMKLPEPFFFEEGPRAVILFHAYTGSSNDMRMLGRALQRANYTVYCPQFTGHATGNVFDLVSPTEATDWVSDGLAAYDFLKQKGYQQIVPIGLSLGGIIAPKVALEREVIGVGSLCSPIMESNMEKNNVPYEFYQFAKQVLTYQKRDNVNDLLHQLEPKVQATMASLNDLTVDIRKELKNFQKPYYIAEAGLDQMVSPNAGKNLRDYLTETPVDLNSFEKSGHVVTVDKQHHELETSIIRFLDQLDWK